MQTLTIPGSDFNVADNVWLHYGGALVPTYVLSRRYDPEMGTWFYMVLHSNDWQASNQLTLRTGEAA